MAAPSSLDQRLMDIAEGRISSDEVLASAPKKGAVSDLDQRLMDIAEGRVSADEVLKPKTKRRRPSSMYERATGLTGAIDDGGEIPPLQVGEMGTSVAAPQPALSAAQQSALAGIPILGGAFADPKVPSTGTGDLRKMDKPRSTGTGDLRRTTGEKPAPPPMPNTKSKIPKGGVKQSGTITVPGLGKLNYVFRGVGFEVDVPGYGKVKAGSVEGIKQKLSQMAIKREAETRKTRSTGTGDLRVATGEEAPPSSGKHPITNVVQSVGSPMMIPSAYDYLANLPKDVGSLAQGGADAVQTAASTAANPMAQVIKRHYPSGLFLKPETKKFLMENMGMEGKTWVATLDNLDPSQIPEFVATVTQQAQQGGDTGVVQAGNSVLQLFRDLMSNDPAVSENAAAQIVGGWNAFVAEALIPVAKGAVGPILRRNPLPDVKPVGTFASQLGADADAITVQRVKTPTKRVMQADTPVKPAVKGRPGARTFNDPNPETAEIEVAYKRRTGIDEGEGTPINKLDKVRAKEIADEYDRMPEFPDTPESEALTQQAYKAMADETLDQYDEIAKRGYKLEIFEGEGEPYKSADEMIRDLRENRHMYIFGTESGFGSGITPELRAKNPLLAETGLVDVNGKPLLVNDVFRFVHDFFGHSKRGNGFGPVGEENAWDVHARMYTPLARRAMTSETRGQNSWVNFSGANEEWQKMLDQARALEKSGDMEGAAAIRAQMPEFRFADQKTGLLPEWVSEVGGGVSPRQTRRANLEAGIAATRSGGGYTFDPDKGFGRLESGGYSVGGVVPSKVLDPIELTPELLEQFIDENVELFKVPGRKMGLWEDPDTGKVYLDVNDLLDDEAKAIELGMSRPEEKAIGQLRPDGTYERTIPLDRGGKPEPEPEAKATAPEAPPAASKPAIPPKKIQSWQDRLDDAEIDDDKGAVRRIVNEMHKAGVITDEGRRSYLEQLKDKDLGAEDVTGELRSELDEYSSPTKAAEPEKEPVWVPKEESAPTPPKGAAKPEQAKLDFGSADDDPESFMQSLSDEAGKAKTRLSAGKQAYGPPGPRKGIEGSLKLPIKGKPKPPEFPAKMMSDLVTIAADELVRNGYAKGNGITALVKKYGLPRKVVAEAFDKATAKLAEKILAYADLTKGNDAKMAEAAGFLARLPDVQEYVAAAMAGRTKRGWYKGAMDLFRDLFGDDTLVFSRIVAATSPRQTVEENLVMSLDIYGEWVRRGRPSSEADIRKMFRQKASGAYEMVHINARVNNSVTALSGGTDLSGYKVDSFAKNLLGDLDRVTNDTWMGQMAEMAQRLFAKNAPGYDALSAVVKQAAEEVSKLTGEVWTPAEIQETVWSFFKHLRESGEKGGKGAEDVLKSLTHEELDAVADFANVLKSDKVQNAMRLAGIPEEKIASAKLPDSGVKPKGSIANDPAINKGALAKVVDRVDRRLKRAQATADIVNGEKDEFADIESIMKTHNLNAADVRQIRKLGKELKEYGALGATKEQLKSLGLDNVARNKASNILDDIGVVYNKAATRVKDAELAAARKVEVAAAKKRLSSGLRTYFKGIAGAKNRPGAGGKTAAAGSFDFDQFVRDVATVTVDAVQRTGETIGAAMKVYIERARAAGVKVDDATVRAIRERAEGMMEGVEIASQKKPDEGMAIQNSVTNILNRMVGDPVYLGASPETVAGWAETAVKLGYTNPEWAHKRALEVLGRAPDQTFFNKLKGTAPGTQLSKEEALGMGAALDDLSQQWEKLSTEYLATAEQGGDLQVAKKLDNLREQISDIIAATNAAGSEWGRAGVARQAAMRADGSFAGIVARRQAAVDRELTVGELDDARKQAKDIEDVVEEQRRHVVEKEAQKHRKTAEATVQRMKSEVSKEASSSPKTRIEEIDKKIGDVAERLKAKWAKAKADTSPRASLFGAEIAAEQLARLAEIVPEVMELAKLHVEKGAVKLEDVASRVVASLKDHGIDDIDENDAAAILAGRAKKARGATKAELDDFESVKNQARAAFKEGDEARAKAKAFIAAKEREAVKKYQGAQRTQAMAALREERKALAAEAKDAKDAETFYWQSVKSAQKDFDDAATVKARAERDAAIRRWKGRVEGRRAQALNRIERLTEKLKVFEEEGVMTGMRSKLPEPDDDVLRELRIKEAAIRRRIDDDTRKLKAQADFDNLNPVLKGAHIALSPWNAARSVVASFDNSFPMNQGLMTLYSDPKSWWKGVKKSFASAGEQGFERTMAEIKADAARFEKAEAAGLFEQGANMEDIFGANAFSKVPGISHSQRMYEGGANALRFDLFNRWVDTAEKFGGGKPLDLTELKALATEVKTWTGQGVIAKNTSLSKPFFALRYRVSQFEVAIGAPAIRTLHHALRTGNWAPFKVVAAKYAQGYATLAVTTAIASKALEYLGGKDELSGQPKWRIELNPNHTDFGRLVRRTGSTTQTWDVFPPATRMIGLMVKVASGDKVSTTGKVSDSETYQGKDNREKFIGEWITRGLHPVVGAAWAYAQGKDTPDKKYFDRSVDYGTYKGWLDTTVGFAPISVQSSKELWENEDLSLGEKAVAQLFLPFINSNVRRSEATGRAKDDKSKSKFGAAPGGGGPKKTNFGAAP